MKSGNVFLVLTLLLLQFGCSGSNGVRPEVPAETNEFSHGTADQEMPLSLRVIDEVNDGKEIHVQAGVTSAIPWNADRVVAVLSSLKEGVRGERTYTKLSQFLTSSTAETSAVALNQSVMKPGSELVFSLAIPAEGVTDYQLELLWGKDAESVIGPPETQAGRKIEPKLELRGLQVIARQVKCTSPPCGVKHTVSGTLFNSGLGVADKTFLGVGYLWIPAGSSAEGAIPESEEKMELSLGLGAGRSRTFTFHLDQVVPLIKGGEFRPSVRLLPVQSGQ